MTKLNVKVYADGANIEDMQAMNETGNVSGFTTNPSLMKKAGIRDYNQFAKDVVAAIPDKSISFEVFADDFSTMEEEAKKIATFGKNVFVKIPITNSKGESSIPLIKILANQGIKLNVTAIFTLKQVKETVSVLKEGVDSIVSVFAGRVADTGIDPVPLMKEAAEICHRKKGVELLWASPREVLNIIQANQVSADIITCTPDLIKKMNLFGKDLSQYSLETVQMFLKDSTSLGFKIL